MQRFKDYISENCGQFDEGDCIVETLQHLKANTSNGDVGLMSIVFPSFFFFFFLYL